jgi:hypothetical protein
MTTHYLERFKKCPTETAKKRCHSRMFLAGIHEGKTGSPIEAFGDDELENEAVSA